MAEPLVHHIPTTEYWLMYFGTRIRRYTEEDGDPLLAAVADRRKFSHSERKHLMIERIS